MGFFKKKPPKELPIIDELVSKSLIGYATDIINNIQSAFIVANMVPGLMDYLTTSLAPSLVTSAMSGQFDKLIGKLASDVVVGGVVTEIARIIKEKRNA